MAKSNNTSNTTDNVQFDRAGIWISGLCAVHCLALPVLLPMVPLIASSFFAEAYRIHVQASCSDRKMYRSLCCPLS